MIAVDTNILVYRLDKNEPVKRRQAKALTRSLFNDKQTVLLWQVLAEYMRYLSSWELKGVITRSDRYRYISGTRRLFPLVLPSEPIIDRALDLFDRYSLSHWDSMLLAACLEANVDTLYTEDMGAPRQIDSIRLMNPF